jgi:hypothetical protein
VLIGSFVVLFGIPAVILERDRRMRIRRAAGARRPTRS